jgi:hypothetical protein
MAEDPPFVTTTQVKKPGGDPPGFFGLQARVLF